MIRLLPLVFVLCVGELGGDFSLVESKVYSGKVEIHEEIPLTIEDRVRTKLKQCSLDSLSIEILLAQAKFESGNFTNNLTQKHNNLWSMRHPRKRPTKSLGPCARAEGRNGYASFKSVEDSVEDIVLYLEYSNIKIISVEDYCRTLKKKKFYEANYKHYRNGLNYYLHD